MEVISSDLLYRSISLVFLNHNNFDEDQSIKEFLPAVLNSAGILSKLIVQLQSSTSPIVPQNTFKTATGSTGRTTCVIILKNLF